MYLIVPVYLDFDGREGERERERERGRQGGRGEIHEEACAGTRCDQLNHGFSIQNRDRLAFK